MSAGTRRRPRMRAAVARLARGVLEVILAVRGWRWSSSLDRAVIAEEREL